MQAAETTTYPVMRPFPLFVALCDHHPESTNVTDGRHTDERHNLSANRIVALKRGMDSCGNGHSRSRPNI